MAVPKDKRRVPWVAIRRWSARGSWSLVVVYLVLVLGGLMNPSTPVDYAMNLGSFPHRDDLMAPDDGVRHVVVLQHGIWRSAGSLWKLERALRDHGYEVINESYPSTTARIEEHAEDLVGTLLEELFPPPGEGDGEVLPSGTEPTLLYFVGHSMGGLVLQSYLQHPLAFAPVASVFLATPHRGAVLTDLRRDGFLFKLLMGHHSALQLSPGHAFNLRDISIPGAVGTIVGGSGDAEGYNEDIPGDDDGTVAVAEAHLAGEDDSITLRLGHTRISFADQSIHQVLYFLKYRRFER